MRGIKAKLIRKKSKQLLVDWLSSMLDPKELPNLTEKNYKQYLPDEQYVFANNRRILSAFTDKWMQKKIKKLNKPLQNITVEDIING
tara:strand:+ start:701 stop:961 length:261 start_codon:yes stop_codon:yes gene_type:complete